MTPNFLCVFIRDESTAEDVLDVGRDPDFSDPVPTWGICRPQVRSSWVKVGSRVVFVGRRESGGDYRLKGIIEVGEIIGYLEALRRFPTRRNVIIRSGPPPARSATVWKNKHAKRLAHGSPSFLREVRCDGNTYHQNSDDDHQIDNWKCQRLFLCRKNQLYSCIQNGRCDREDEFDGLRGYVVAKRWLDVGSSKRAWEDVRPASWGSRALCTPLGQHNALRVSDSDIDEIVTRTGVQWMEPREGRDSQRGT